MSVRPAWRRATFAVMLLGVASCDSFFELDRVQGTYELSAIGGALLPTSLPPSWFDQQLQQLTFVDSDSLILGAGGRGEWRSHRRSVPVGGGAETPYAFTAPLRYELDAGRVLVTIFHCTTTCRATWTFPLLRRQQIELVNDFDQPWSYVRVGATP